MHSGQQLPTQTSSPKNCSGVDPTPTPSVMEASLILLMQAGPSARTTKRKLRDFTVLVARATEYIHPVSYFVPTADGSLVPNVVLLCDT